MQPSLSNKRVQIIRWVEISAHTDIAPPYTTDEIIESQCYIFGLPNEVHEYLLQKIKDVETLINYFNSCKKSREISLLVNETKFIFKDGLSLCRRTFKTYLEYLRCYRFTINIKNFKSFRILGFVTDMPEHQLKIMSFTFVTSCNQGWSQFAHSMIIVDHGFYREIVFNESIFQCKCIDLNSYTSGIRRIHLVHNSEFFVGRNAIYEKIHKENIQHTASIWWQIQHKVYIISFYTELPRLK